MTRMLRTTLALAVAASALGAGTALASPPQQDTIFAAGTPGNPVDTNGNRLVCAIPLPDAARDAKYPPAEFPFLQGIAFYLFTDDNGAGQAQS